MVRYIQCNKRELCSYDKANQCPPLFYQDSLTNYLRYEKSTDELTGGIGGDELNFKCMTGLMAVRPIMDRGKNYELL